MPTTDPLAGHVRVGREGTLVTITIQGRLDANAGVELLAALQDQIDASSDRADAALDRVDVDLQSVEDWSPEGARALRRARRLARVLEGGLHFRCAAGAGHAALLEAFAHDYEIDGDGDGDGLGGGDGLAEG